MAQGLMALAGSVLKGVGETGKEVAKSTIDEQRQARLEKTRSAGRTAERATAQEFQTSERIAGQEHQVGMAEKKAESALAVVGAKEGRVTAKSTTKNDDGTLTITYTDGSAEILDPETGTRTKYGDESSASADIKRRDNARAEADSLFENLYGGMFTKSQIDLSRFNDSKDLAKARITDMIMEGSSDSDIIQFMIRKGGPETAKPTGATTRGSRKQAAAPTTEPARPLPPGLPDASQNKGKTFKDDSTGIRYKSNGATWSEV